MAKILIVDDEESILSLLSAVVGSLTDCVILQARGGQEAIEVAKMEKPDVIVLDNRMPGMSGLEVCGWIKAQPDLADTKILMLSCQGQNFDWPLAQQLGASDYLSKPFDTEVVMQKVKSLVSA